jgi:hypothetical protein
MAHNSNHPPVRRPYQTLQKPPEPPKNKTLPGGYGGTEGAYRFVSSLVTLDTVTGELTELHPSGVPPTARAYHSFSTVGHVAYIFGGRAAEGVLSADDPTLLCAYDSLQVSNRVGWGAGVVGNGNRSCHKLVHTRVTRTARLAAAQHRLRRTRRAPLPPQQPPGGRVCRPHRDIWWGRARRRQCEDGRCAYVSFVSRGVEDGSVDWLCFRLQIALQPTLEIQHQTSNSTKPQVVYSIQWRGGLVKL